MRAPMLLVIAMAGTYASQAPAGATTASASPTEATASPATAENAADRAQAASASDAGSTAPAAATPAPAPTSASTDAPVKEPTATQRSPTPKPATAEEAEEPFRIPPTWKPRVRGDETVYCRKEGESGTRFRKTECYTLAELKYKLEAEKAAADDITRRARVCSSAGVCSSN